MKIARHQLAGIMVLLIGMSFLGWGNFPNGTDSLFHLHFKPGELSLPGDDGLAGSLGSPVDGRLIEMTGPGALRLGDTAHYKLVWFPDGGLTGEDSQDVYKTHNLVAQTRLEIDGLAVQPSAEVLTPLRPGMPVEFSWLVRADSTGLKKGVVWIHLNYLPLQELGSNLPANRKLIAVPEVTIKVSSFLGIAGLPSRVIGGVMTVIGLVLVFEPAISAIITNLFKKDSE